jgi:hypothetical protein
MSSMRIKSKGARPVAFMAEFQPLKLLWEGANPPYPSEFSARWFIRKTRAELAAAQAIAIQRGRMMVHPQRFAQVAEQVAIAEFSKSFA